MRNIYLSIISLNLFLAFLMYINGMMVFLLNFEFAFSNAGVIIFFSFKGYKRYIQKSIDTGAVVERRDTLDQVEDPFELYDDEENQDKAIEEEKTPKKPKKEVLKTLVKTGPGYFSLGRMGAYAVLAIGFITLAQSENLSVAGFLAGLTLGLICSGYIGFMLGKKH